MTKQINLTFNITESSELLEFMYKNIKDKSKNNIKSLLTKGNTFVNDKCITKHNYILKKGDILIIKLHSIETKNKNIDIIYEDKELVVVNKPYGLLSVSTLKEKEKTMYHLVSEYVKKNNPKNKIYVVHRLDKDTSGILIFSKSEKLRDAMQEKWNDIVITRGYIAIVEGNVKKESGTIKSYLKEGKNLKVYSTNKKDGKEAITHYKKIDSNNMYSLLEIKLDTGRKNQIRVHMNEIGYSIIGDTKYGSKSNPIKRMGLHSNILEFIHPITNKKMHFETKTPSEFLKLFKK